MDKYIEVLCKQNPETELECGNPECKSTFKVKSKEFFKDKEFNHTCDNCGKSTSYGTEKFVTDFKRQLKELGITVS